MTGVKNNYSIKEAAAAILLTKANDNMGFSCFKTDTYPQYHKDSVSFSHFSDNKIRLTVLNDYDKIAGLILEEFFL